VKSMVDQTIINKYRPTDWEELIGHTEMMGTLRRNLDGDTCPHAFLFTGPGGTGKTTTARIVANHLQCSITEIDAASYSTVDDARQLVEMGRHRSLDGSGRTMFIIDECHALSKAAFQALLKLLEEPPPHLYLSLCTTELTKVPDTIKQRCFHVLLRPVKQQELEDFLSVIADMENWHVHNDVMAEVVRAAQGSPRKGLTILQAVHDAPSREEVARIIQLQETTTSVIDVVQFLLRGGREWQTFQGLLGKITDEDLQSGMVEVCRYITAWLTNSKTELGARHAALLLEDLLYPVSVHDAKSQFFAAACRVYWRNK
jgi:DNA polymerase-3 subunit gamma/tau